MASYSSYGSSSSNSSQDFQSYFVPGYGISRHIIFSHIQYYLGPYATVRPYQYRGREGFLVSAPGQPLTKVRSNFLFFSASLNFPLHILQALCKLIFEMSNARSARLQLLFSFQLKNSNATIGFDARHGSLQIWKSCQYGLQPLQRLCARLDHGLSLAIFSLVCKTRLPASYLSLSNTKNTSYFFSIKFVPPLIGSASLCFYFRAAIRMPPYLVAMTILHTILWLQNVG